MSDAEDAEVEIPQLYRHHAFACYTQRPPNHPRGSWGALGAMPLWEHSASGWKPSASPLIGFTASGCLGFCNAGPLMVVYPDGVWYRPTTTADIDAIVDSHFKQGKRVDRLVMILTRS